MITVESVQKHYGSRKDIAARAVEKMELLLQVYKEDLHVACPLCNIGEWCGWCPWTLHNNHGCRRVMRWFKRRPWRLWERKRQLRSWIKIYKKALETWNA